MKSGRLKVVFGGVVFLLGCLFVLPLLRTLLSGHLDRLWKIDRIDLYLLRLGMLVLFTFGSVFLIGTGLRMMNPELVKPFKFGWGRVFLGSSMLYSQILSYYHLLPEGPLPRFEPRNQDQLFGMVMAKLCIGVVSLYLIFRGIETGFSKSELPPAESPSSR